MIPRCFRSPFGVKSNVLGIGDWSRDPTVVAQLPIHPMISHHPDHLLLCKPHSVWCDALNLVTGLCDYVKSSVMAFILKGQQEALDTFHPTHFYVHYQFIVH